MSRGKAHHQVGGFLRALSVVTPWDGGPGTPGQGSKAMGRGHRRWELVHSVGEGQTQTCGVGYCPLQSLHSYTHALIHSFQRLAQCLLGPRLSSRPWGYSSENNPTKIPAPMKPPFQWERQL